MATFKPSGYGAAVWHEEPPAIPSVGGNWPSPYPQRSRPMTRGEEVAHIQQAAAARREQIRQIAAARKSAAVAARIPGAPRVPVGPKDLVLLTEADSSTELVRRPLSSRQPLWQRSWFWPVTLFSVALGVFSSSREGR